MKKIFNIYTSKPLIVISRIIISFIFIYASVDKILNPVSFAEAFINYNIAPIELAPMVAVFIPWFELVFGIMILLGIRTRFAAFSLSLLLVAFMFGITLNLIRGVEMDCGCFEFFGYKEDLNIFTLLRDILFLFFSLSVFLRREPFLSLDSLLLKLNLKKNKSNV